VFGGINIDGFLPPSIKILELGKYLLKLMYKNARELHKK